MDQRPKWKILRIKHWHGFCGLRLDNGFIAMTQKAQVTKEK
jgi:hypothetical protein